MADRETPTVAGAFRAVSSRILRVASGPRASGEATRRCSPANEEKHGLRGSARGTAVD